MFDKHRVQQPSKERNLICRVARRKLYKIIGEAVNEAVVWLAGTLVDSFDDVKAEGFDFVPDGVEEGVENFGVYFARFNCVSYRRRQYKIVGI